jgi:hypothetical protein
MNFKIIPTKNNRGAGHSREILGYVDESGIAALIKSELLKSHPKHLADVSAVVKDDKLHGFAIRLYLE